MEYFMPMRSTIFVDLQLTGASLKQKQLRGGSCLGKLCNTEKNGSYYDARKCPFVRSVAEDATDNVFFSSLRGIERQALQAGIPWQSINYERQS